MIINVISNKLTIRLDLIYKKSSYPSSNVMTNNTVTAAQRETCWKARDFYLACLATSVDSEHLYKTLKESTGNTSSSTDAIIPSQLKSEECERLRLEMYSKCPESWVMIPLYTIF